MGREVISLCAAIASLDSGLLSDSSPSPARRCTSSRPTAPVAVPFVAKATGVPLAKVARVMLGATSPACRSLLPSVLGADTVAVKGGAAVRALTSTGAGARYAPPARSGNRCPSGGPSTSRTRRQAQRAEPTGTAFLSLADADKPAGIVVAKRLSGHGAGGTEGAAYLASFGLVVDGCWASSPARSTAADGRRPARRRQAAARSTPRRAAATVRREQSARRRCSTTSPRHHDQLGARRHCAASSNAAVARSRSVRCKSFRRLKLPR